LIIGDLHIPQRAVDIPEKFKELLQPNKMQYVISTGNIGSKEVRDFMTGLRLWNGWRTWLLPKVKCTL